MSHFSVLAVGFKNKQELRTSLGIYSENLEVEPYIVKSKQDVYAEWKDTVVSCIEREFTKPYSKTQLKKINKDIESEKLDVDYLLAIYEDIQDKESENFEEDYKKIRQFLLEISTPQAYLENTYSDDNRDEIDNILSTYNPQSKFDYYDITETITIRDLKNRYQEKIDNFDEELNRLIWRYIVNGDKTLEKDYNSSELMWLLWGTFSKDVLLQVYETEDNYIYSKKNYPMLSYTVVTPEDWFEPGTVGWFGLSTATAQSEKDFVENYYKNFIEPYPDDMKVYLLDCHI